MDAMPGATTGTTANGGRKTARALDVVRVLWAPRAVFARVEDVPRYGWPIILILTAVTLIGLAQVQSGLVDRAVDRGVQESIAALELAQRDVVERSVLRDNIAELIKAGEFLRLITRIKAIVANPATVLATALLVAAILYGVVALTGRKPEWHTLLTVTVYACSVSVLGLAVRLAMMLHFQTLEVQTSLMPLAGLIGEGEEAGPQVAALAGLLGALDPFRIWFWCVVAIGARATAQLTGWRVWLTCGLCWLFSAGVRSVILVALVSRAMAGQ